MPDPTQVRVRLPNGATKTFPADHPAVTAEGSEVLDAEEHPAVDQHGEVLPTVYPPAEAPEEAHTSAGYAGSNNDVLRAEIDRRNEGRDEADLIPRTGNKSALVAALEADDIAQANVPGTDTETTEV